MASEQFILTEQLQIFKSTSYESLQQSFSSDNIHTELYEITDRLSLAGAGRLFHNSDWEDCVQMAYNFTFLSQKYKLTLINALKTGVNTFSHEFNMFYARRGNNTDNSQENDEDAEEYDMVEKDMKSGIELLGLMATICLSNSYQQIITNKADKQFLDEGVVSFQTFLPCLIDLFEQNLSRMFVTSVEKKTLLDLFITPIFLFMELEQIYKNNLLKGLLQSILCLLVKLQNEKVSILNLLTENIAYQSFSINFYVEFLKKLYDDYDYPQLTEDVLRSISNKEFNSKDIIGPKNVSLFLVKLSEAVPQVMLKQIQLVTNLLNNSSFTLRNAVVEACGNIVFNYYRKKILTNDNIIIEHEEEQCSSMIDLLENRLLDTNPYVRSKAVQGIIKLASLKPRVTDQNSQNTILPFQRRKVLWTQIAVRSLQDRSYLVRRYCIKLVSMILLNHPFSALHGSQLAESVWNKRLQDTESALEKLNEAIDDHAEKEPTSDAAKLMVINEGLGKLKLTIQYYKDALEYINLLNEALDQCCKLISSKNKSEVIESMDFFVLADAYDVERAYVGIKKMLHLIWQQNDNIQSTSGQATSTQGFNSATTVSVPQHLVQCYKTLFLTAPDDCDDKEKAAYIAKNLINLTISASFSDLASLERILILLLREKVINSNVITVLWVIFKSFLKQDTVFNIDQIHGSIIIIGMLASEDHRVVSKEIETLLSVGLHDNDGQEDFVMSKYTCIALIKSLPTTNHYNSLVSDKLKDNNVSQELMNKISQKLQRYLVKYTENPDFYPFAESAIECLFRMSNEPELYCEQIIMLKNQQTFSRDDLNIPGFSRIAALSQFLFLIGEMALKLIVYLEHSETQFKKSRNKKQQETIANKDKEKDEELEMISKTTDDDFNDSINFIRENKILLGSDSIFGPYLPMVITILTENEYKYRNFFLQRVASLTLLKFMLTSKKVCESNLPLLITIMEKSEDPVVRSNCILGFGDISVTFNSLIDDNIEFLYNRLMDEDLSVKNTCLMTITFLILAGQVKVKGHLGKMALCLVDSDLKIVQMSKIFFNELSSKDNAVYNGFLDIFNFLSSYDDISNEKFQFIVKFLMSFIQQERYQKNINNKLIAKLKTVTTESQYDKIVYVLQNLINNKDESLEGIIEEGFKPMI